jgi:amino acid transporter
VQTLSEAGETNIESQGESHENTQANTFGLKNAVLNHWETLAQSVAGIAPSAAAMMIVPLVYGFAREGAWLSYLIATVGIVFVAAAINQFAKRSASPGSLYSFVYDACGYKLGLLTGWSLLFAYICGGAACCVEFALYANAVIHAVISSSAAPIALVVLCALSVGYVGYKNIKLSASLMLRLEMFSIALILLLMLLVLAQHSFKPDWQQLTLKGVSFEQIRLGLVLAIFSFVGFESAASLGAEAAEPLKSIPKAITQSVVFSGVLFILSTYTMVLGFDSLHLALDKCSTPSLVLSQQFGAPILGHLIDLGVTVSFFAAALAILNAGSRTLFFMGHHGVFHSSVASAHKDNATPHISVFMISAIMLAPAAVLVLCRFELMDIIGWLGTLSTYGFIFAYIAVSIASLAYARSFGRITLLDLSLAVASIGFMCLALVGTFYPVPPAPYNWLGLVFLAYMIIGGAVLITRHEPNSIPQ